MVPVDCGAIRTNPKDPIARRLHHIHQALSEVIRRQKPDEVALESVFVSRNVASALKLGQARGVCLLAAGQAGLAVAEYAPAAVKAAVTGHGRAGKKQIGKMVRMLLGIGEAIPEDTADALAVAYCHFQRTRATRRQGAEER